MSDSDNKPENKSPSGQALPTSPSASSALKAGMQPETPTLELDPKQTMNPEDTLLEFAPEEDDLQIPTAPHPGKLYLTGTRAPSEGLEASLEHSDAAPFTRPIIFDERSKAEGPLEILPVPLDEPLELDDTEQAPKLSPVPPELDPNLWDEKKLPEEDLEAILAAEDEGMEGPEQTDPSLEPAPLEIAPLEPAPLEIAPQESIPLEPSEPSAHPVTPVKEETTSDPILEKVPALPALEAKTPNLVEPSPQSWEAKPLEEVILASTTGERSYVLGEVLELGGQRFEIVEPLARGWYKAEFQGGLVLLKPGTEDLFPTLPAHRLTPRVLYSGPEGYVLPWLEGEALRGVMPFEKALSALTLLAQYTFALEKQGYALLDLEGGLLETAEGLKLRFPPRLMKLGNTLPTLEHEGYTAPELRSGGVATGKEGVYLLGAILLEWLTGSSPLTAQLESVKVPGVPPLLYLSLSSLEKRFSPLEFLNALRALNAPSAPVFELGHGTSVGLNPDRPVNEDSYAYRWERIGTVIDGFERLTAVVCDGMGGMAAGEVASNAAVRAFVAGTHGELQQTSPQLLEGRVWKANRAVLEDMGGQEGGCTLSGVVLEGANFTLAHVGDSRAYKAYGSGESARLEQISQDHSLVAAMVASGILTPAEAMVHPDKNKILRSLGSLRQEQAGYVQTLEGKLEVGEALLLLSDGVWNEVPDPQILEFWKKHGSQPQRLVDELISASLEAGAPDNATALIVRRKS